MYNYLPFCYDELTENVDYEARCNYICSFFNEYGIFCGDTVLDLACGSGTMALLMKQKGYEVIGMDASAEMLSLADNKAKGDITFIRSEMQNFTLAEPVNACMCNLDSVNHLGSIEDVKKAFACVYHCVAENGIFIFDVNTVYKHNAVLADNTFVFDKENYFLCWDNELLEDNRVRILLDLFVFNGKNYDRFSEEFTETAYSTEELCSALKPYFDVLGIYDDLTRNLSESKSERLYFVCRRK
mgnify:CR=1 FL=1